MSGPGAAAASPPAGASSPRDEAAALDHVRRRVLNVVGHALRTPMATLRGLIDVVATTDDPQVRAEAMPALVRQGARLERLLDDVLVASDVLTRLPTGMAERIELASAVHEAAARLDAADDVQVDGEATVDVGRDALGWMLHHLLDNALRYGSPPVEVRITDAAADDGTAQSSEVILTITSEGDPLPESDLAHAFELFYRGEAAVMASASGMGVGLPVVERLAQSAGGRVSLANRSDGGGVTAVLRLPRAAGS